MKVLDGHVLLASPKIWPHFRRGLKLLCFLFFAVNFLPGVSNPLVGSTGELDWV